MAPALLTRRRFLGAAVAGGASLTLAAAAGRLVERAVAAGTRCASLGDIDHVIVVIQENRSFDHFFGTYPGVAGFSDPRVLRAAASGLPVWYQYGWGPGDSGAVPTDYLLPFHLDTAKTDAECTSDVTHAWVAQHQCWHGGAMDRFVSTHVAADGVNAGPMTMGYYTRSDLGFYYALADAFTICDHFHCSVMGPTVPNRLYSMSATIDPDGSLGGGPVVDNPGGNSLPLVPGSGTPSFGARWLTMPDVLESAGVSWKFYQPAGSQSVDAVSNNVLLYFSRFRDPSSPLFQKGVAPTFPGDFQADVASGRLPAVSFIASMSGFDEHPPAPIPFGELYTTRQVLATLVANPAVWERSVVFLTYDENGGFFDHVAPPTAPAGTPGEWVTTGPRIGDAGNPPILGPIGLGFRVPMLVLSPFTVGGLVCSEVSDHTSILRFVETRFGVGVPNLSAWRRANTGDLTAAINFKAGARAAPMQTDVAGAGADMGKVIQQCPANALLDASGSPQPYPVPPNSLPAQEPHQGPVRRPSGPVPCGS